MAATRYNNNTIGMEELLNSIFGSNGKMPPVDVIENEESYSIVAEVPGFDPSDSDLTVERHMLTISGKQPETKEEGRRYFIRERQAWSMKRSFQLPEDADEENISADFENGVLTVNVKKQPKTLPRKISVKIGKAAEAIEAKAEEN